MAETAVTRAEEAEEAEGPARARAGAPEAMAETAATQRSASWLGDSKTIW